MSLYFCLRETADIAAFISGTDALPQENIPAGEALGRVLVQNVYAPFPCPACNRSTRDGYAVRSADVAGARPENPVLLQLAGECRMGALCSNALHAGEAWRVYTGSNVPEGADEVIMQEDAAPAVLPPASRRPATAIAVYRPGAAGQHLLTRGADLPQGELLAQAGTRLGAHHLALLAQFFQRLPVHRRPVLGVLATGDEFCPPDPATAVAAGQHNTNALLLQALATTLGARCQHLGTVPDDMDALNKHLRAALPDGPTPCDVGVVVGGSSGGKRDFSAQTIRRHHGTQKPGRERHLRRLGQTGKNKQCHRQGNIK